MRTTLDIDDDILEAAKDLANSRRTTAGKVLSDLARRGLEPRQPPATRNGAPLLPAAPEGTPRLTLERVNRLRDEP